MARYISTTGLKDISFGSTLIEADETGAFEISPEDSAEHSDALAAHGFVHSENAPVIVAETPAPPAVTEAKPADAPIEQPVPEPEKPADETGAEEPAGIYGSSVQPAIFTLETGETVQLGAIVAEACRRSGLTAQAWNDTEDAIREQHIAEVVAELPPLAKTEM